MIIPSIIMLYLALQVAGSVYYEWTWWSGEQVTTRVSWPPAKGQYRETSEVGSRYRGGFFVDTLTNSAYVIGGIVPYGDIPYPRLLADMWKCDFSRDQGVSWTWIHGSNQYNDFGIYTEIGDENSVVYPSARYSYAHFYDRDSRKFYMFGGDGFDSSGNLDLLGDHWSYNVENNSFVWLGGSNQINMPSNYTLGVESPYNKLGAIYYCAFAYSHTRKEFFIFSGTQVNGRSNILWRYRPSNNMFTALSGNSSISASSVVTFGVLDPANMPSGRLGASMLVTDEGRLYVLGGYGFFPRSSSDGSLVGSTTTELWMYDLDSNMWALVSGTKYAYDEGIFSNDSSIAYPSSRSLFNLFYDTANNIALFHGGKAYGHNDAIEFSDEWIFNLTSHQWTYIRGYGLNLEDSTFGSYRVTSPSNRPGRRYFAAVFSAEEEGFMFGGPVFGDLWKVTFNKEIVSTTTSTTAVTSATTFSTSDYLTTVFKTTTELWETTSTSLVSDTTNSVLTTLSTEHTSAESTTEATAVSSALPETIQTSVSGSASTTIWMSSYVVTSETSTEEIETSTPASFSSTAELSYTLTKNSTSYFNTSSDISSRQTNWSNQNTSSRYSTSKDSTKSTVKNDSNFVEQRFLDPAIIMLIAVLASILLLILLAMLCYFMCRRRKAYFAYSRSSFYKSKAVLPMRSNTYEMPSFASTETTRGDTTLMGTNTELLSIPAYLEVPKISFRITSKLSHGGGGDVFLADALDERTCIFGKTIIVKTVRTSDGKGPTDKQIKLIEQELSIMAMFREHKNIAKVVGFCREDNYYILMKYYRIGSLDKFLRDGNNHVSKQVILSFISDISSGLQAMHQKELAHSDIKSANVLIDVDEYDYAFCVLTDFGITQVLSLSHVVNGFSITNITGLSVAYASPEAFVRKSPKRGFSDKPAVFKAGDIYSTGAIIFELMTRKYPWSCDS